MVIGTNSRTSLFDVLQIGVREHIREVGYPEELFFETHDCTILLSGTDFDNRVDSLRITLKPKNGLTAEQVSANLTKANIPNQVLQKNGSLVVNLPPFEWRQLARLAPADKIIEDSAVQSLRSRSWQVTVKKYRRTNININVLIEIMKERDASDLHLRAGSPPYIRVDNDLMPLEGHGVLSADDMQDMVFQLGGPKEVELLEAERESSFNFHATGIGYLRVSGYFKHGAMALAVRLIPEAPVPFEQLNIPMVVRNIAHSHRGLFLVCGVTGSGKSTTLASMLDYINEQRHCHIISVEDPVEFVYKDKKSIISQRQVGRDTFSFANALRGALREDPDVILVGEMRDMETIRAAISAAETGHLVFSTLHTMTAVDTVNRVISYFPQAERDLIRQELAYALRGVVCQRLLKRKGGGRVPCVEILLGGGPLVRDAILEGEIERLHQIIEVDSDMKLFDQHAVELFQAGTVTREEAVSACSNEQAFDRIISGIKSSEGRKILG